MIKPLLRMPRAFIVTALLLSVASAVSGQETAPAPANSASTSTSPAVADGDVFCPEAFEPYLPGDYYACVARRDYGRQKYKSMIKMLEEAAYWANKDAQYVLGLTYFNGETPEVPQDRPLGIAWLALAAERKNRAYQLAYMAVRAKATPQELTQARTLWQRLHSKYGDDTALPRAVRRFNHAIQPLDDAAADGGIVWLRGFSPQPETAFKIANRLHDQASAEFDGWRADVVVGKPDWLKKPPTPSTSASGP